MTRRNGLFARRDLLTSIVPAAAWMASQQSASGGTLPSGSPQASSTSDLSGGRDNRLSVLPGDGKVDLTEQVQDAVRRGGGVYLQGTIRLSKPIRLELDHSGPTSIFGDGSTRIIMTGPGPAFHIVGTHDGTAAPETVQPQVWERQRMPCIDGLSIEGEHDDAGGLLVEGTMGLILTRLHIRQCHHAVHLRRRNRNVIIEACHIYHNRGIGIYYDQVDLHQSNIGDCHISYNAGGGIVSRGGNVRNIHIGNCDIEGNHPPADASPEAATANVLIDCSESDYGTAEVAITGCTIQHTARSPNSANIRILGASNQHREGNITITGNVLSDVQTNIHLDRVCGATLLGNTFWMGFQHNLLLEECKDIAIGINNLNRNPRYRHSNADTATHDLLFRECENITCNGMVVTGVRQPAGALRMERCRRVTLNGCTFGENDGPSLVLDACELITVSGCILGDRSRQDEPAVVLRGGSNWNSHGNIVLGRIESRSGT